jgi:hypothetical protein
MRRTEDDAKPTPAAEPDPAPAKPQRRAPEDRQQPFEPSVVADLLRHKNIAEMFAVRAMKAAPKLEDYDTEGWITWKALKSAAPVDASTRNRERTEYFAPDPLEPGKTFLAPDNVFWRGLAEQGYIERAKG